LCAGPDDLKRLIRCAAVCAFKHHRSTDITENEMTVPGFVCSKAMGTCLKVCSARDGEAACPFGMCQLSQAFPEGWGVCVGRVEGR
jgi:hypothetical protein